MLQHSRRQRTCYLDLSMRNLWLSSWAQKIDQKSSLVLWKIKYHPRREKEVSPFEKAPYLEPEEIRTEERFQLLVKPYNNNRLQEDNYPVSEIQEECQIPLEKPSLQVLLPLARVFSTYSGLYKVIRSPSLSLLKKLNVRIIIYLDNMLLTISSLEDFLMARDLLIFILQHLGFLISIKKFYLEPTSTLEFLGMIVDSGEMTLSLRKEKLLKVQNISEINLSLYLI